MDVKENRDIWKTIKSFFPFLEHENFRLPYEETPEEDFSRFARQLIELNMHETIESLILMKLQKYICKEVGKKFWSFLDDVYIELNGTYKAFSNAVGSLEEVYKDLEYIIHNLEMIRALANFSKPVYGESTLKDAITLIFRSSILAETPTNCNTVIKSFYRLSLMYEEREDNIDLERCDVCKHMDGCNCEQYFFDTNRVLFMLNLMDPLVQPALLELVNMYIGNFIAKTCGEHFDTSFLEILPNWLDVFMGPWIRKVYACEARYLSVNSCEKICSKLNPYTFEHYTKFRLNQLFSIIIDFPESTPALEDLRICLPKTNLRPYLIKVLQKSMETRLLHPGVSTQDILTAYVATIRSMRVLDPSGLLLETITQPIHQYLRTREDTVRCVVSSLTEDGLNDLAEELIRGEAVQTDENVSSDDDDANWDSWKPDPIEANPGKSANSRRTTDIISMLVNVYGSKELFVNEYRTVLADRLLTSSTWNTEREIRYLELLKLRFGDAQLHFCEVMLKDIVDSKRINQNIKQDANYNQDGLSMTCMILSAQFWPAFKDEKCELHPVVVGQMREYTKAFETLKGNRTLCWKKHLGLVNLEIELPDRTLTLPNITPIHATIIIHFQDKRHWTLDELSRIMQLPATLLRRKIGFWQSHGLIEEVSKDSYQLSEDSSRERSQSVSELMIEDESESPMASTQDQREEELQTIWSYIVGMLMNLESLNIERIHQMLKMFAFQVPSVEITVQELRLFLDKKVRNHQLLLSGGLYRLPKP